MKEEKLDEKLPVCLYANDSFVNPLAEFQITLRFTQHKKNHKINSDEIRYQSCSSNDSSFTIKINRS
jgi:hypothetical protein